MKCLESAFSQNQQKELIKQDQVSLPKRMPDRDRFRVKNPLQSILALLKQATEKKKQGNEAMRERSMKKDTQQTNSAHKAAEGKEMTRQKMLSQTENSCDVAIHSKHY